MKSIQLCLLALTFLVFACQPKGEKENNSTDNSEVIGTDNSEAIGTGNQSTLASSSSQLKETRTEESNLKDPDEIKKMKMKEQEMEKERQRRQEILDQKTQTSGLHRGDDGKIVLPSACSLVTSKQMADWLDLNASDIQVKDGNPKGKDSRSCFFKWDDPSFANTGILIQLLRNPVEQEVADWPTYFIDSKRETGEQLMAGADEISYIFKPYTEFGDDGAYSDEVSKWYWRIKDDAIVMVAFNMNGSSKKKADLVKKIGKEIMKKL